MRKFLSLLTLLQLCIYIPGALASPLDDSQATERVGFDMRDLNIFHQKEWRHLSVHLEYESDVNKEEVSTFQVKKHVRDFLTSYAEPMDFWEIMNTHLVRSILDVFPNIRTLKSQLALAPDEKLFFPRQSTVMYDSNEKALKESFSFTKLDYLICNQTFESLDMHVAFDIKENPDRFDYPDYLWLDEAMEEFFKESPLSFSLWSGIKPKLEVFLLKRFENLTAIKVDVTLAK